MNKLGQPGQPLVQLGRAERAPRAVVSLSVDGRSVSVPEGTTILGRAAIARG